jgi:hypothetical protein
MYVPKNHNTGYGPWERDHHPAGPNFVEKALYTPGPYLRTGWNFASGVSKPIFRPQLNPAEQRRRAYENRTIVNEN